MLRWSACVLLVLAGLGCAGVALGRTSAEVTALLPHGDPHLTRITDFFAEQGAVRMLALSATAADDPTAARRILLDLLPELAGLGATPVNGAAASGLARAATLSASHAAVLVGPEALTEALTPAALARRMADVRARLAHPDDTVSASLAARDPLGLTLRPLAALADGSGAGGGPAGARADGPLVRHPDGVTWMLPLTVAFAPEDLTRARPLVERIEQAIAGAAAHRVRLAAAGPYRHYVANQRTISSDLTMTLPLSLVAAGLVLWSLLGRWRLVLVSQIPPLLGLLGACLLYTSDAADDM
jgi:hypothetical protein